MDLWIRSQDRKRITKVEDIYIAYDEINSVAYIGNTMIGHLGRYKTFDRALEVLDEIQDLLQNAYTGNLYRIVYQIPNGE